MGGTYDYCLPKVNAVYTYIKWSTSEGNLLPSCWGYKSKEIATSICRVF